ncbi:DUF6262 family protein [Nocardia wallacei]|uniref:DUF6262 family protein n=1 Tax=Nocardia wallacei TaxID=480035 RepID=UPI002454E8B3|nr:DUF6262 family protein [Nocardia wallacei]
MRADNSRHIVAAAKHRRELTRAKAIQALKTLDNNGATITFESVASAANVSRSWLYAQPDIRAEIERLRVVHRGVPSRALPARQRTSDASLRQQLDLALKRIQHLTAENQTLRKQLAHTLGELRAHARPERTDR